MDYSQPSFDSLADRLRTGDHNAATELVDACYQQIYAFMRRLGHNRQTSEDLTQETFFQAWQHINQLHNNVMLFSWLYRIAVNVSKRHLRSATNRELPGMTADEVFAAADGGQTSADEAAGKDELYRLSHAVAELPIKLKQAVVLHYMQHLTIAEASDAADVRQGTYKSRLNRALKLIKKRLEKQD
jgi:RNA polymerase sigma-70 factor, ECF subfamily